MAYRKAKCIELYALGAAFATDREGYANTAMPGRSEFATRPVYKIPLIDLMRIGEVFSLDVGGANKKFTGPFVYTHQPNANHVLKTSRVEVVEAAQYEINLYQHMRDVGDDQPNFKIIALEVEVIAANLANIRVTLQWINESDSQELDVDEISYSGAFTVWWERSEV